MTVDLVETLSMNDMRLSCRMIIAQASYLRMNATGELNFCLQTLASSVSSVQTQASSVVEMAGNLITVGYLYVFAGIVLLTFEAASIDK